MEHNYISLPETSNIVHSIIYKRDNNLDNLDNLDELPREAAVYAICGRVNGKVANCRFVGETQDLQKSVKDHFSNSESYDCLRQYMQSIKIKELVYELMPGSTSEERLKRKESWEDRYIPLCNEELNEVH